MTFAQKPTMFTYVTHSVNTQLISSLGDLGRRRLFSSIKEAYSRGSWDTPDLHGRFFQLEYLSPFELVNYNPQKIAEIQYLIAGLCCKLGSWKSQIDGALDQELLEPRLNGQKPLYKAKIRRFYGALLNHKIPALEAF